ncbi:MAG: OmcA/MtrC family decaheme c-type cytochrome [Thermoanaerobaculia bacterium]
MAFPTEAPRLSSDASTQPTARRRAANPTPATPSAPERLKFTESQLEYYLNDDGIAYIRPGLKVKVNSITVGTDRRPVVDITITDDLDQPLDRAGKITPGAVSPSFILSSYDPATREYSSITTRAQTTPASSPRPGVTAMQGSTDSGGTWTDLSTGRATYKFKTAIPASVTSSQTLTLGIYAARNLSSQIGKNYYFNLEQDFRLDGAAVAKDQTWDKIHAQSATCNNCHDPLSAHGGSRRDLKLCVLCHNPTTIDPDTGESQDMEVLVHKLHFGHLLPSVQAGKPYIVIGHNQTVFDASHFAFPQDMRNCDTCHEGLTAAQKASQTHVWYTNPTKHACFSCHDNINLETGEGHPGMAQADNSRCPVCHVPDSGNEFDASIKGAHVIPTKSNQLLGLQVSIVSATNMKAGQKPTVTYKITDKSNKAVDGSKLSTFAPMIAGPTGDYTKYFREAPAVGAASRVYNATTGNTSYTFTNAIPADATGTWVVSGDFYMTSTIKRADGEADITGIRDAAFNPIAYYSLATGTTAGATPRRTSVDIKLCNTCHDKLALHGGQRQNTQECVICHNPVESDTSRRPAAAGAPESISMARLIHRIHRGVALEQDFTVYGFGGSANNYNEIGYPGDLRNCTKCHVSSSQQLPPPVGTQPTIAQRDYFSPQGPGTAACLGCHDTRDAAAHAFLNTTTFRGQPAEACATCHGVGSEWSVDKVHAR